MSYASARKKAAQKRAADKLIAAHPDEYRAFLEVEMAVEGYARREVVTDEWVQSTNNPHANLTVIHTQKTVESHGFRAIHPQSLHARVV